MTNIIKVIHWDWNYWPIDKNEQSIWSLLASTESGYICMIDASLPWWLSYPDDATESGYKRMQDYVIEKYWKWNFWLWLDIAVTDIAIYDGSDKNWLRIISSDIDDDIYGNIIGEKLFSKTNLFQKQIKSYYFRFEDLELEIYNSNISRDKEFWTILDTIVESRTRFIIHKILLWWEENLIWEGNIEEAKFKYALPISGSSMERIEI